MITSIETLALCKRYIFLFISQIKNVDTNPIKKSIKVNFNHKILIDIAKSIGLYTLKTGKPMTCLNILTTKVAAHKVSINHIIQLGIPLYIR